MTLVDVAAGAPIGDLPVAGPTRWTVFDPERAVFSVNIADLPQIVVVDPHDPSTTQGDHSIPSAGAQGLDLDTATRRLFCVCDGKQLVTLHADTGQVLSRANIGGVPDVISLRRRETVQTERGAHTLSLAAVSNTVYAFYRNRAVVFIDRE